MNMGHRCCSKQKVKRGLWSPEEDEKLSRHITTYGHGSWSSVPKLAGLQRCGKSCRLRWINYLRPDLKKGSFTQEEEQIIIDVHRILGNRWAQIAKHLPGRTDNEVKNFWNSCIKKKLMSQGLDPQTHNLISSSQYSHRSASSHAKSNATSTFVVSHENHHEQEPVSVFSMSSSLHEITTNNNNNNNNNIICSSSSSEDRRGSGLIINPPFQLTLPSVNNAQSSAFQHYGPMSSIENSTTTPNVSSSSSSSLDVQNLSCFADHDFGIWGSSFEPFDHTPRSMEGYNNNQQQALLGRDNNVVDHYDHDQLHKEKNISEIVQQSDHRTVVEKNSSSSFDLGFLESALMSDLVCHDLSSMEYDLSWNY